MKPLMHSEKAQGIIPQRILVIRLGALGDFVQSFGPFQAIRQAFPAAHITLLTTAPFVELARLSPWFDEVLTDTRPRWTDVPQILALRKMLRGYDRVYDLQTSAALRDISCWPVGLFHGVGMWEKGILPI